MNSRVLLHVLLRPFTRLLLMSQAWGSRTAKQRRLLAGVGMAGLAFDLVETLRLRRNTRTRLVSRAVADLVDTAVWARLTPSESALPSMLGCPLVTEVSLLYGPEVGGGLVASQQLLRSAVDGPASRASLAPTPQQLAALTGGFGLRRLEQARTTRLTDDLNAELRRRRLRLEREGRHRVASNRYRHNGYSWETPHDVLTNVRQLLRTAPLPADSPLRLIEGRKQLLHEDALRDETFDLASAFRRAKGGANRGLRRSAPDAQLHDPQFLEGDQQMIVISGEQLLRLGEILDAENEGGELVFVGEVTVRVVASAGPGREVELELNDRRFVLPADPELAGEIPWFDPLPWLSAVGVLWCLGDATSAYHGVRLRYVIPGTAAHAAVGVFAARQVARRGEVAYPVVAAVSLVPALIHTMTVAHGLHGRTRRPDGTPVLTLDIGTKAAMVIAGFAWDSLDLRQRLGGLGALTALVLLGFRTTPHTTLRRAVFLLSWNVGGGAAAHHYRALSERTARDVASRFMQRRSELAEDVVAAAEREEWRLLGSAAQQALEVLPAEYRDAQTARQLEHLVDESKRRSDV